MPETIARREIDKIPASRQKCLQSQCQRYVFTLDGKGSARSTSSMSEDTRNSPPVYHFAPVANYYGTPYVTMKHGVPLIGIEDHDGHSEKEISAAFYHAWLKEFEREDSLGSDSVTDLSSGV